MCPGIVNLGIIHPNQCVNLYNSCDIVFVPSLLEIFTAVYPEAMASGKPIVTNNLSFAKSICGDAALYYDYSSAEDASLKIIELIENNNLRLNLINNGLKRLSFFDTSESRFSKILQTLK
jgi:glycosyltransferase involved in cell wall biosynthesis